MNERVLNLLSMCLQAKEKGRDVFFYYSPHVQSVEIRSHENGWESKGDGIPNLPTVSFTIYIENGNCSYNLETLRETEAYLKGLIA